MDEQTEQAITGYWRTSVRSTGGRTLEGIVYYNKLSDDLGGFREMLSPSCFEYARSVYLCGYHDYTKMLSSTANGTLDLKDTPEGLKFRATIAKTKDGDDLLELVRSGTVNEVSFGFNVKSDHWLEQDSIDIRVVDNAILSEISVTPFAAYPENYVEAVRSKKSDKTQELRKYFSSERKGKTKMKKKYAKVDRIFSKNPWKSNDEFLRAVINATSLTEPQDIRLTRATGLGEGHQSEGGFLTKKELIDTWLYGETASDLYKRCFKVPVGEGVFQVEIPMIHETSRAEGDHMGGLRLYYEDEADEVETSTPKFRSNKTELKKLIGICPVTDELMQDGPRMERLLSNIFGQKLRYSFDEAILNGTGSGRSLGLKHAPGTLTIAKELGQNAATVVSANILKMVAGLPDYCRRTAAFIYNPELDEQLFKLNIEVGTGGSALPLWQWKSGGELYNKLAGFDAIPNEHCGAPGESGDIFLADLSRYAIFEKQSRETISSHLYFLTDESAFRLVYRFDGQPLFNAPTTPINGSDGKLISPFIKIAERA